MTKQTSREARLARIQAEHPPTAPVDVSDPHAVLQHFGGAVETPNHSVVTLPTTAIAPDLEHPQPRMLPLPDALMIAATPLPIYAELVADLQALGQSLHTRQLQPVVVTPGRSARFPQATHLLVIGHRRWTAAMLTSLPTLDAVVIPALAPTERIIAQYTENAAREDFSDMERAWTLEQIRHALPDPSVRAAGAQLGLKLARAYQLRRLLAYTPAQQQLIALLRLHERQIKDLTDAVHNNQVSSDQVSDVLAKLQAIAADRVQAIAQISADETLTNVVPPRESGIDTATVARLVAQVQRHHGGGARTPQRWYHTLRKHVTALQGKMQRARERADELGPDARATLYNDLVTVQRHLDELIERLTLLDHSADPD